MAVLYYIKVAITEAFKDACSTEETRIGSWIIRRSVYRKVFWLDAPVSYQSYNIAKIENMGILIKAYGIIVAGYDESIIITSDMEIHFDVTKDGMFVAHSTNSKIFTKIKYAVIEYIKTTGWMEVE